MYRQKEEEDDDVDVDEITSSLNEQAKRKKRVDEIIFDDFSKLVELDKN